MQQLLSLGVQRNSTTLAREVGMTKSRLSQLLDLTLLAPDIQEEVLMTVGRPDERQPITERMLRRIVREADWEDQRRMWAAVRRVPAGGDCSVLSSETIYKRQR